MILSHKIEDKKGHISRLYGKLQALNPRLVLARGYSITTRICDGHIVTCSADVKKNEDIHVQFARGAVRSVVKHIEDR